MTTNTRIHLFPSVALAAGAFMLAGGVSAHESESARMLALADEAGCVVCHRTDPTEKIASGLSPIGPSWVEVAAKYGGDPNAVTALTQLVLQGSDRENRHWEAALSSGMKMPANNLVIDPGDAERLVAWIMSLAPLSQSSRTGR